MGSAPLRTRVQKKAAKSYPDVSAAFPVFFALGTCKTLCILALIQYVFNHIYEKSIGLFTCLTYSILLSCMGAECLEDYLAGTSPLFDFWCERSCISHSYSDRRSGSSLLTVWIILLAPLFIGLVKFFSCSIAFANRALGICAVAFRRAVLFSVQFRPVSYRQVFGSV